MGMRTDKYMRQKRRFRRSKTMPICHSSKQTCLEGLRKNRNAHIHQHKLLLLRHYCASDERSEVTQTLGIHLFDQIGTSRDLHFKSDYYLLT